MWIEIEFSRNGSKVCVSGRGSRGEQVTPTDLDIDVESIAKFASAVRSAANQAGPLPRDVLETSQKIQASVLGTPIGALRSSLAAATSGPLLVRFVAADPDLRVVPWEAMCKPLHSMGFLATSRDVWPVRSVLTTDSSQPRVVRTALRILAIAPTEKSLLEGLKEALAERIASGEIEWLEPLEGPRANAPALLSRLGREPFPHVLHFLGHGGHHSGAPVLRLADTKEGKKIWLPVESLARQLKAILRKMLRLIVLEACDGSQSSAIVSAAEILNRAGADAVIAHLWPIKSEASRVFSKQLYRILAGAERSRGDVARAMNEGRRAILAGFDSSAQAFSPVMYLRGPDGILFDFEARKVDRPPEANHASNGPIRSNATLTRILQKPFSLVLGDGSQGQGPTVTEGRDKRQREPTESSTAEMPSLSANARAPRFALNRAPRTSSVEFHEASRSAASAPKFLEPLARLVKPGVHVTLSRHLWLEVGIAEQQPDRTIYVIEMAEQRAMILRRDGNSKDWVNLEGSLETIDIDHDIVVLRPHGGHSFERSLPTEDEYLAGFEKFEGMLPAELAHSLASRLLYRPALFLSLSIHTPHHRALLKGLFRRGIPRGSLAVLEPGDVEPLQWEKGAGLPGNSGGVEVLESSSEDFGAMIQKV
jgi:CHAT domain